MLKTGANPGGLPIAAKAVDFDRTFLPYMDPAYNLARWLVRNDHDAQTSCRRLFCARSSLRVDLAAEIRALGFSRSCAIPRSRGSGATGDPSRQLNSTRTCIAATVRKPVLGLDAATRNRIERPDCSQVQPTVWRLLAQAEKWVRRFRSFQQAQVNFSWTAVTLVTLVSEGCSVGIAGSHRLNDNWRIHDDDPSHQPCDERSVENL
jgi:hypothetical protein